MKKIAHYIVFYPSLLFLGGCETLLVPDAPHPPPLPASAPAVQPPLTLTDVAVVQTINEQSLLFQAMAGLASTHSTRDFTKNFATDLATTYKKIDESAIALAKGSNLTLPTKVTAQDQMRVTSLGRIYYNAFDRALFRNILRPLPKDVQQQIDATQKSSGHADMKKLADSFVQAQKMMQQRANDLLKY